MPLPLLHIDNLQIDFVGDAGVSSAVSGISFQVNRNEILAIVGESGSGKSVTALSILQLLPAPPARYSQGAIWFSPNGQASINLLQQSPAQLRAIRGNQIAMIFQEPMTSLNPLFTCGNQVMEAIRQHQSLSAKAARAKTLQLFEQVQLPDPASLFHRYPHQLSGGQKQRVMIAMAMSCEPDLLICDEPTTALDVTVQKTILGLLRSLQASSGMGVIFITHDLGVVAEVADRAIVLYKGNIVEEGPVSRLFSQPQHPYTKGLLACRPALHPKGQRLPVVSDFLSPAPTSPKEVLGRTNEQPANTPSPAARKENSSTAPLLEVNNLRVWFAHKKDLFGKSMEPVKAVDDVSFTVYKGETLGLVGESGCGKTTLGRSLLQLIAPTGGSIRYNGQELTTLTPAALKALRKDIQIVFQDPYSSLNPRLPIGSALQEPLEVHRLLPTARQRKERVMELLEKVNLLPEHFYRYPHEFSGGQRQRIVIARTLALNPDFIICDESVSALDVSVQAQVLNLLNELKKEFGFTSIFISHDLSVVRYISDRIMVMNKGRIEEIGEAEQVYAQPRSAYTRRLIAAVPQTPAIQL
ncbi:MAG: ABC transporter ATP-binding protein [Candidatus Pseudobacter hemicellulosilyticus]|uniref:ABC transporter ATP-binding protein n=1 Tax=Candidatus Pseudobacter hemicellulosilyticus TaxID=3121375 RepID=A0AAJ5WQZ7_9BACT|nr:MAG: ABC transporter ATP-binding protein [Pseudobacter sp.]